MPLNVLELEQLIYQHVYNETRVGATDEELLLDSARAFAKAYAGYAKNAQAACGALINASVLPAQEEELAGALATGTFGLVNARDPSSGANAYVAALGVFWANPLLWVPIPPALPVASVTPTGGAALIASLAAFTATDNRVSAAGQAAIFDAYTRLVVVTQPTVGPPFVCALPIF